MNHCHVLPVFPAIVSIGRHQVILPKASMLTQDGKVLPLLTSKVYCMSPCATVEQLWVVLGIKPLSRSGELNHSPFIHPSIHLKVLTWCLWGITNILWGLHSRWATAGCRHHAVHNQEVPIFKEGLIT